MWRRNVRGVQGEGRGEQRLKTFLCRFARLLSPLALLLFALRAPARAAATDIYISQAGGGNGSSCSSTQGVNFFNSSGNWGVGAGQIGPGTTVHLCGTFTGTAGSTMLTFQGSGTANQPITLFGESGAHFIAPYWGSNGAININGQSYILVDGGANCGWDQSSLSVAPCNLVIEDTQNGTNLAYQAASRCFEVPAGSSHIELKNFACQNLYQKVGTGAEDYNNYIFQNCVDLGWSGAGVQSITVDHAIMHDVGWCLNAGGPGPLTYGPGLEIYNTEHTIATGAITQYIFGNHFHDWGNWTAGGTFHHDGLHCFDNAETNAIYMYDNQFDGMVGPDVSPNTITGMTGFLYAEQNAGSVCFKPGSLGLYLFNNVGILNGNAGAAYEVGPSPTAPATQTLVFANNTTIGNQQINTGGLLGIFEILNSNVGSVTFTNNATGGGWFLFNGPGGLPLTADYNFWENCANSNGCWQGNSWNWWTTTKGFDAHGGQNIGSQTYFGLNSACVANGSQGVNCSPVAGSPLLKAGANLTSLCQGQPNPGLGALCFDIQGTPRPTTGPWDVGAYQSARTTPACLNACDINCDGADNVGDVQAEINMVLQKATCTNPSGSCNVTSVQKVINAALGGTCVAP